MKKAINLLLLPVFVFILFSCEKAQVSTSNKSYERYLSEHQVELLFASIKLDNETNTIKGFFINKDAELSTFNNVENTLLTMNASAITDSGIAELISQSTFVADISPEEVAKSLQLATSSLNTSDKFNGVKKEFSTTSLKIYFYGTTHHDFGDAACSPIEIPAKSVTHAKARAIIESSGQLDYTYDRNEVNVQLSNWLSSLESKSGMDLN
ncbi:MAG: hypothetical protein AB8G86_30355 [Saprospiraceae bacterium]